MANESIEQEAARVAAPWIRTLARYGYAAKGAVYIVVGVLALQAALGTSGTSSATADTEGALRAIFRQPLGPVILVVIGIGLFGYTSWRLTQSLFDVEKKGHDFRGLAKRVGYFASGVAYGGLGVTALRQAIGLAAYDGRSQEDWTRLVLAQPFGRWLIIAAGGLLAVLAINAGWVAVARLFKRKLKQNEMSEGVRGWASTLAITGLLARGVVFGLLAVFFVQAGWESNPEQAGGLSDVVVAIAAQPQGPWLLGLTAAGLMAYGVYAIFESRYRRIPV